uniref:Uncharacterized protein n=1 Tax=Steinernema glaseri TaxID=37863 RepID=A0A1I7YBM7_9BILA
MITPLSPGHFTEIIRKNVPKDKTVLVRGLQVILLSLFVRGLDKWCPNVSNMNEGLLLLQNVSCNCVFRLRSRMRSGNASYDIFVLVVCVSLTALFVGFAVVFCCVAVLIQRSIDNRTDHFGTGVRSQLAVVAAKHCIHMV